MMEWVSRLNEAVDYIEVNLDKEISYDKAAQLACCSTFHFIRMFSYIADVFVKVVKKYAYGISCKDLPFGSHSAC